MENVLLIALSRQTALRREMDIIANNVANANTNGFKRRISQSREFQMPVASADTFRRGEDRRVSFVIDRGTPLDLSGGTLEPTNNPLDVAISGEGFFVVQTPQGERYTRNGAMMLNANGELVNSDGFPLLGEQGNFQFSQNDSQISIAGDGTVATSNGSRGRLRVVRFPNPQALENVGANLFSTSQQAETVTQARVQAGFVERSNVKPVLEISRMIEVNRAYQSVASLMSRTDETRRSAIQKLGEPI
ncbi:MAG: flagellar basal-body rod protein FlgF [Methylobacterium sp.]|nr:flagellar basal-body rod protein FlgF [Methylobacterium sp.]